MSYVSSSYCMYCFGFCILAEMIFFTRAHTVYNNSDKDLGEHNHLRWIALSRFSARICLLCWNMLLLYEHECGFCLYERALETAADRDCQGKRWTSMRRNAMCEFRCLIDPSGPQSLFSISIYRHLSSHDHVNVSPFSLLPTLLLFCSQAFARSVDPHSHSPTRWFRVSTQIQLIKQVKDIKRYVSGFYYLVWERQVGKNGKTSMYCLQTTGRCSCRSGESTSSCGSLVSRGPLLPVLSSLICVCVSALDTSRKLHLHTLHCLWVNNTPSIWNIDLLSACWNSVACLRVFVSVHILYDIVFACHTWQEHTQKKIVDWFFT